MKTYIFTLLIKLGLNKKKWLKRRIEIYENLIFRLKKAVERDKNGWSASGIFLCCRIPEYFPYLKKEHFEEIQQLKSPIWDRYHIWFINNTERLRFVEKCLELAKSKLVLYE